MVFDGGYGWADTFVLKKIYQFEQISEEKKNEYIQHLIKEDSDKFSEFLEFKEDMERYIFNIRQVLLYGEVPMNMVPNSRNLEISKEQNKLFIYLTKDNNKYINAEKIVASHVLEQVVDNQGNVVSEEIKPFTYKIKEKI